MRGEILNPIVLICGLGISLVLQVLLLDLFENKTGHTRLLGFSLDLLRQYLEPLVLLFLL